MSWKFYTELDYGQNFIHIDTRDFYGTTIENSEERVPKNIKGINKRPNTFLYTEEEIKDILQKLYVNSGGKGDWRMLQLTSTDPKVTNWRLKYIRIINNGGSYYLCNSDFEAISKSTILSPIDKEYLNHCI